MSSRASSERIAASAANSWYGAVGAAPMRRRTSSVASRSGKRGTVREDIVGRGAAAVRHAASRDVRVPAPRSYGDDVRLRRHAVRHDTLGHARTFVVFDLLARLLESGRGAVRYAQNVTDVDEVILP